MAELERVGELIEQQPYDYRIWNYRRRLVSNIGAEAVSNELKFTNKILLSSNPNNIQAWSHREWIIQKFDKNLWLPELQYCHQILDRDVFNVSAWEQICRAARLCPPMTTESRDIEVAYAKKVIYAQPGNEGPWNYLTFLYLKDLPSLYTDPNLECIYVDFLAEEADGLKFSVELHPPPDYWMTNYTPVDRRGCLNALNLVAALMVLGYEPSRNTRLVEALDVLLENLVGTRPNDSIYGSKYSRKVSALVLSLDASRILYSKRCRGYNFFYEDKEEDYENFLDCSPIIYAKKEEEEEKYENSLRIKMAAMDVCDNLPLQQPKEQFETWLTSNGFGSLPMEWKERLYTTYLQKRKQYNRDENDALEDLKWYARRLIVKIAGGDKVALDELKFTSNIINDNAYNHHAWSHRQWVFHVFGEDWEDKAELEFCAGIIEKNPYNSFAWDQRYFVITRLVSKIDGEMARFGPCSEDLGIRVERHIECLDEKRSEEVDFALKFMVANPENHLPWGHISGLANAYGGPPESFCLNMSLINAIIRVLEEARDFQRLDLDNGNNGSVMRLSDGSAYVNNARAIINALSMLLEFTVDCDIYLLKEGEDIFFPKVTEEGKRCKAVLDELCPDSWFETFCLKPKIPYMYKMCAMVGAMEKALTDCGRLLRHPVHELLTPSYLRDDDITF